MVQTARQYNKSKDTCHLFDEWPAQAFYRIKIFIIFKIHTLYKIDDKSKIKCILEIQRIRKTQKKKYYLPSYMYTLYTLCTCYVHKKKKFKWQRCPRLKNFNTSSSSPYYRIFVKKKKKRLYCIKPFFFSFINRQLSPILCGGFVNGNDRLSKSLCAYAPLIYNSVYISHNIY